MEKVKMLLRGPPRLTLAVAESMTCGRLQAKIGAVSGASEFFLGGITAYTLAQKVRHLGVARVSAAAVNSVSAEVAEQMARGVCGLFGSDVGMGTTGYAEPSVAPVVPVPYAWWALVRRGADGKFKGRSGRVDCPGLGRVAAQERVAEAAILALGRWLAER
jgi:nicotinamide-nucleotide amidase